MGNELAQRLIKARSGHGWSQADLAEVSGVAAAQISRYEQGRSKPRTEVLGKLARSMAVDFEWLAFGRGSAEAGLDVPVYPAAQKLVTTLELDTEMLEAAERIAQENGWSIEMAVKQAILHGARLVREEVERSRKAGVVPVQVPPAPKR